MPKKQIRITLARLDDLVCTQDINVEQSDSHVGLLNDEKQDRSRFTGLISNLIVDRLRHQYVARELEHIKLFC